MDSLEEKIWYLSYGSNMNPVVLSERRKVYPIQSLPCTVPGYELNFNYRGVPYFEPSFASIHRIKEFPRKNRLIEAHGVIHLISKREMWAIRLSEGGNGHDGLGYDLQEVTVTTYSGKKEKVVTLIYPEVEGLSAHPSRRYMNLILEGARVSGLAFSYQTYLQTLPVYERKTLSQGIATCLFGIICLTIIAPHLALIACYRLWGTNKRPPRLCIVILDTAMKLLHLLHEYIFCPLFGSGTQSSLKVL
jgi:hypothetical protein